MKWVPACATWRADSLWEAIVDEELKAKPERCGDARAGQKWELPWVCPSLQRMWGQVMPAVERRSARPGAGSALRFPPIEYQRQG